MTSPAAGPRQRVALITGAGRGLGRAVALSLAADGWTVALLGRREEHLAAVADRIRAADGGAVVAAATADVADPAGLERAVDRLEAAVGPPALLVNNAGIIEADEVPIWRADPGEWRRVVEVDLIGAFQVVRAVVPRMLAAGRRPVRVVNLSSGAAVRDSAVYTAYHAAKTGLSRITTGLHLAGAPEGLLAFDVSPGVVRTDMTAGMRMHDDREDWTPEEAFTDLVLAVAGGGLDAWSGRHLRAGADTVDALTRRAASGLDGDVRRVRLARWGADDPYPG